MKRSTTIFVVDDEPLAVRRLELLIAGMEDFQFVGSATSCADAVERIGGLHPDVLILDVKMRDGTGFDVVERLPADLDPVVIFATAFDIFAVEAFEVEAIDYILKPISRDRLEESLARATATLRPTAQKAPKRRNRPPASVVAKVQVLNHGDGNQELWVRGAKGELTKVLTDQIIWVASEEDYIRLHLAHGSHLLRLSLKTFEERFCAEGFTRVHRRALVRTDQIARVERDKGSRAVVILRNGSRVEAGRVYAKQLLTALRRKKPD